jgi:glycosyltransferase involved in cell wall biosynthesis
VKVLVSAYACEPHKGSEPGVGWNWAKEISRFAETWVITRANNREGIERAVADEKLEHIHFEYFDLPPWARTWKRGRRGIHAYYYLWQLGSARVARRLHRQVGFDLAHHVTLSAYWMPSGLAFLDVPMIWGPLGGAEVLPQALRDTLPRDGRLYEMAKGVTHVAAKLDPLVRLTSKRSSLVLMQTLGTRSRMQGMLPANSLVCSAVGIDCAAVSGSGTAGVSADGRRGLRVISVGRLLAFKALHLGVRAFSELRRRAPDSEYVIVGAGPEAERLRQLAATLGLTASVRFTGSLPRAKVLEAMQDADVLLHPSMRDPPATVVAEAMAAGLPVVCLHHAGPGAQVTPESGIRVALGPEASVIEGLSEALILLHDDPAHLARLKAGARTRALEEFDWRSKGRAIEAMYRQVLSAT